MAWHSGTSTEPDVAGLATDGLDPSDLVAIVGAVAVDTSLDPEVEAAQCLVAGWPAHWLMVQVV